MYDLIYISFIKIYCMNMSISYNLRKIDNIIDSEFKMRKTIFLANIITAILYSIFRNSINNNLISYSLTYLIYFFILKKIFINTKIKNIIIATGIAIIGFFIATTFNYFIIQIDALKFIHKSFIETIIIGAIQITILYIIFKIKRFKNGFSFLRNNNKNILGIFVSIILIVESILIGKNTSDLLVDSACCIGLILGGVLMFNWIKRSITNHYKKQMKDRTVELQAEQLKEKDEIINNLKEELSNVLKVNHKYNHRLSAMELAVSKLGNKINFNEEFASEYSDVLDTISNLSKEYKSENSFTENNLPKTNVYNIDNILEYMTKEAKKKNIDITLKLKGSIKNMVDNIIPKNKLETMLADHIQDAIIAINENNSNRNIMIVLGLIDRYYELCIYDTGIEFEIETLLKLGLERVTTHKDNGGSGIGFMTTFEVLKEYKASLIIEEKHEVNDNDYTKSVTIRFDNKNEYKIRSYRADEIRKMSVDSRIIIENLQSN